MSNDSSTGGYLSPAILPDGVVFRRLLGSLISGLTGISAALCRPLWQPNPPKTPGNTVNWCGFGVTKKTGDKGQAVTQHKERTVTVVMTPANPDADPPVEEVTEEVLQEYDALQRYEYLDVQASFYGPNCLEYAGILRDGLEIAQNREALYLANCGVAWCADDAVRIPELINDIWYDRADLHFTITREISREYAIQSFVTAGGTINAENIVDIFDVHKNN